MPLSFVIVITLLAIAAVIYLGYRVKQSFARISRDHRSHNNPV